MATRPWQESVQAAHAFVRQWSGERRERAEKDTFWNELLAVFGISRRRVAQFEPVARRYSTGRHGFIDVFWPGRLLVEHKGRGADLAAAMDQAMDYLPGMAEEDLPQVVVVCDFDRFVVRDLDTNETTEFTLAQLPERLGVFSFLTDPARPATYEDEEDVNLAATELLAVLHDALRDVGYDDHQRRVLLTRLLFCLFADDAQVWPQGTFQDFLLLRTHEDGADLGAQLAWLFDVLDTDEAVRPASLPVEVREFRYINGGLFAEPLPMAYCDRPMRQALLKACRFNWSKISPAIFGSMFQNVMTPAERRSLGAHYTTEANILRTIRPLFLDALEADLAAATTRRSLREFVDRLAGLRFLDPACGCGNFLVIAYREVRRLELAALVRLREASTEELTATGARRGRVAGAGQLGLEAAWESRVHVGQFYGIELEEFPCRIAETAMHLMDHLANLELSAEFGQYYARFPITDSAHITHANALRTDWGQLLDPAECDYVFGNPPFVGMSLMSEQQDQDADHVFAAESAAGLRLGRLDYVATWYAVTFRYLTAGGGRARAALVSTNSLVQGEQARSLGPLFTRYGMEIDFAHRPFAWTSEAKGTAAVHVVIVGFSVTAARTPPKTIYDYTHVRADPIPTPASRINVYLVDADTWVVAKHSTPLIDVPKLTEGNRPEDGGGLIVTDGDAAHLRASDPVAAKYLRPLIGAREMLHGERRWCLWLVDAATADLRSSPFLRTRLAAVRTMRLEAVGNTRSEARKRKMRALAETPGLFTAIRQPQGTWLCVPAHSSENRRIVPKAFHDKTDITHNSTQTLNGADLWVFGILQSAMWTVWAKSIGGRLESRVRVAPDLSYNAYPFPEPAARRAAIEVAAQEVLDVRAQHPAASLADLYDPLATPPALSRAHDRLDRAVDSAYTRRSLTTDADRLTVLFQRYRELTAGLLVPGPRAGRQRARAGAE